MLVLQGLIGLVLLGIAWQDFKFRAVYWWLFVLLLMGLMAMKVMEHNWLVMWADLRYDVSFLGLQLLFLTGYFSVKEGSLVNIFKAYFGLGDLFFLLSITVYFSFFNYVMYYLISLLLIIIISVGLKSWVKNPNPKIPLAGEQALLLLILMGIDLLVDKFNLTTDLGIVNYLS